MCVSIIVACDPRGVIGKENKLPWRMPKDLQLFRQRTFGNAIIMGRRTWDSLPRKPLDGRLNVVISKINWTIPLIAEEGPYYCSNLKDAINHVSNHTWCPKYDDGEIYIIGGASIYKVALEEDLVDRIIMSKIKKEYDGDVKFPTLPGDVWAVSATEYYEGFDVVHLVNKNKLTVD